MLLHKICFFVPLYQVFVSTVTVFENEGVSDNTGESVFQFLVRYGCIKSGKSKDFMLVTRLKVGDLRCSNNSFEFLRIHI